jgi:hypothetical protein
LLRFCHGTKFYSKEGFTMELKTDDKPIPKPKEVMTYRYTYGYSLRWKKSLEEDSEFPIAGSAAQLLIQDFKEARGEADFELALSIREVRGDS